MSPLLSASVPPASPAAAPFPHGSAQHCPVSTPSCQTGPEASCPGCRLCCFRNGVFPKFRPVGSPVPGYQRTPDISEHDHAGETRQAAIVPPNRTDRNARHQSVFGPRTPARFGQAGRFTFFGCVFSLFWRLYDGFSSFFPLSADRPALVCCEPSFPECRFPDP